MAESLVHRRRWILVGLIGIIAEYGIALYPFPTARRFTFISDPTLAAKVLHMHLRAWIWGAAIVASAATGILLVVRGRRVWKLPVYVCSILIFIVERFPVTPYKLFIEGAGSLERISLRLSAVLEYPHTLADILVHDIFLPAIACGVVILAWFCRPDPSSMSPSDSPLEADA